MMGVMPPVLRFDHCDNIGRIIMIGGVSSSTPSYSPQQLQAAAPQVAKVDSDGDNDATESASVKAKESGGAPSLPTDPNRGRNLNISA